MASPTWIVQKFGGTSVGKFPVDIAEKVVKAYTQDHRVAVVCSARSTNTKEEGTTSRLLQAADSALSGNIIVSNSGASSAPPPISAAPSPLNRPVTSSSCDYDDLETAAKKADEIASNNVEAIRESHLAAARANISNPALLAQLEKDINKECNQVLGIVAAARVIDEVSAKTLDNIIAAGEKLACRYMATVITDKGLPAKYIDLSHIVPSPYVGNTAAVSGTAGKTAALDSDFYKYVKAQIKQEVESKCPNGEIPVITGYFGVVPGGLINGVGRGYTDFCAALAAVALRAEELQIWKEVDGIFTADPRKVPTARLLSIITPDEAAELTYYGSEVIHPFTMEQVMNAHIPIRIKNVMNPSGQGTVIFPDSFKHTGLNTPPQPPKALEMMSASFFNLSSLGKGGPTAVTTKNNIIVLNIHSNRRDRSHGFLAHVFSILDHWRLVVDLISTSEVRVSMALHSNLTEKRFKQAMSELQKYGTVDITRKLCIVSLVGKNMRSNIGVAGSMFSTLAKAGINIEMISQGASEINISTVIDQKDAIKALNELHRTFLDKHKSVSAVNRFE